jgi:hypothetical protein
MKHLVFCLCILSLSLHSINRVGCWLRAPERFFGFVAAGDGRSDAEVDLIAPRRLARSSLSQRSFSSLIMKRALH